MFGAGLDVHCGRSRLGIADGWHLVYRQYMGSSWEPGAIAVTLYDAPHRPAIDLKIEPEIPSEVRRSIHDDAARLEVVIRPKVPRWGTSLRNSADENCAPENQHQKNIPREAVF
jgi:hypothetical protein